MRDQTSRNSRRTPPGGVPPVFGGNLWTEENTRRLLQAAVPTPEPDAAALMRVEARMAGAAHALLFESSWLPASWLRLGTVIAAGYSLVLAATFLFGVSLRGAPPQTTPPPTTTQGGPQEMTVTSKTSLPVSGVNAASYPGAMFGGYPGMPGGYPGVPGGYPGQTILPPAAAAAPAIPPAAAVNTGNNGRIHQ